MITTLLWDLDNTLLDFPSAERQALITTFADFTLGPCSPDLLVRYSALNARWWRRLEEGDVTKAELLPGRFREFFAAEGIACTEYDAFNAAYQHHLGDTIVFLDNGYELVKDLHGQVKQYLVTNGSLQAQTRKLKRSGLGELFDGVFISEVVGAEKPSRAQPQTLTADDLPALDPDCIGLHGSPTKVSKTFVPVRTKQTVRIDGAQPEAAVASLLAQLDAAHISLEGGGDHV